MKKLLSVLIITIFLCSCGSYKELSREEKFTLLYRAEILRQKEAREEINKIYQEINKYIAKNDNDAVKEMEEYEKIVAYLKDAAFNYKNSLPGNGWLSSENVKYPSLKEITGEPVNARFRLYADGDDIYDYLTNKLFTGTMIFRYGNGEIDEVVNVKNGKIGNSIQKNKFDRNNNLIQETFYDENENIKAVKKYTKEGGLKEELYIIQRYDNGKVKEDYIIYNGNEKGRIREYNTEGRIIKETEKW